MATMMAAAGSNREGSMIDPLGGPTYWWPFVAGFAIAYLIGSASVRSTVWRGCKEP